MSKIESFLMSRNKSLAAHSSWKYGNRFYIECIDARVFGGTLSQLLIYFDHLGAIYEQKMIIEEPHKFCMLWGVPDQREPTI